MGALHHQIISSLQKHLKTALGQIVLTREDLAELLMLHIKVVFFVRTRLFEPPKPSIPSPRRFRGNAARTLPQVRGQRPGVSAQRWE